MEQPHPALVYARTALGAAQLRLAEVKDGENGMQLVTFDHGEGVECPVCQRAHSDGFHAVYLLVSPTGNCSWRCLKTDAPQPGAPLGWIPNCPPAGGGALSTSVWDLLTTPPNVVDAELGVRRCNVAVMGRYGEDVSLWGYEAIGAVFGSMPARTCFGQAAPAGQTPAYSLPSPGESSARVYVPYLFQRRQREYLWNTVLWQALVLRRPINVVEHAKLASCYPFYDIDVSADLQWSLTPFELGQLALRACRQLYARHGEQAPGRVLVVHRVYPDGHPKAGKRSFHVHFPRARPLPVALLPELAPLLRPLHAQLQPDGVVDGSVLRTRALSVPLTSKRPDVPPLVPVGMWDELGNDCHDELRTVADLFEACRLTPMFDDPPPPPAARPVNEYETFRVMGNTVEAFVRNGEEEYWATMLDHRLRIDGTVFDEAQSKTFAALTVLRDHMEPVTVLVDPGLLNNNPAQLYEKTLTAAVVAARSSAFLVSKPVVPPRSPAWREYMQYISETAAECPVVTHPGYFHHEGVDGWITPSGELWSHVRCEGREVRREPAERPGGLRVAGLLSPGGPDPFANDPPARTLQELGNWLELLVCSLFAAQSDEEGNWRGFNLGAAVLSVGMVHALLNHQTHKRCGRDMGLFCMEGPMQTGKTTLLTVLARMCGYKGLADDRSTAASVPRWSHANPGWPFLMDDPGKLNSKQMAQLIQHSNPSDRFMAFGTLSTRGGVGITANPDALRKLGVNQSGTDSSSTSRVVRIPFRSTDARDRDAGPWRQFLTQWADNRTLTGFFRPFVQDVQLLEEDWQWAEESLPAVVSSRFSEFMRLLLAETHSVWRSVGRRRLARTAVLDFLNRELAELDRVHPLHYLQQVVERLGGLYVREAVYNINSRVTMQDVFFDRHNGELWLYLSAHALSLCTDIDAGSYETGSKASAVKASVEEFWRSLGRPESPNIGELWRDRPRQPAVAMATCIGLLRQRGVVDVLELAVLNRDRVAKVRDTQIIGETGFIGQTTPYGIWLNVERIQKLSPPHTQRDPREWGPIGGALAQLLSS